jgi:hypothetical protein
MNDTRQTNSYVPGYLVKPGEIIKGYLEHAGFTQAFPAKGAGFSKKPF